MRDGSGVVQAVLAPYRTDPASTSVTGRIPEPRYKNPGEKYILYPC